MPSIWNSKALKPISHQYSLFKTKVVAPTQKFFAKGGDAEQIANNVSVGLRRTGNTLGKINEQVGRVLDSKVANDLASKNKTSGDIFNAMRGTNEAVGLAGNLSHQGAQFANKNNYSGSSGDVAVNMLERARSIGNTGAQGNKIRFT